MSTARLINDLVDDLSPVRPVPLGRLLALVALVVLAEGAAAWSVGAVRADLAAGAPSAIMAWRALASLTLFGLAAAAALRLRVPTRVSGRWPTAMMTVALGAVAAGWAMDLGYPSDLPPLARLRPASGLHCVAVVSLCGLPVLALLVFLLRRGATVRPEAAATAAGLAAAAAGGFVWALACPIDDPAYAALWYAVAFSFMAGVARLALAGVVKLRPRCRARDALRRRLVGR